jgi:hypothetical protein
MTLNMKTYKGFNKLPYCDAHIPKAKATTVAETPELRRIQENTRIQSNAVYHADFEKSKGKFTPVVDDPELLRIRQNSRIISNVAYHGDLERKAHMEQKRTLQDAGDQNSNGIAPPKSPSYMDELSSVPAPQPLPPQAQQQQRYGQQPVSNYRPNSYNSGDSALNSRQRQNVPPGPPHGNQPTIGNPSPYSARGAPNVVYSSDGPVNSNSSRKVGSIADYDPVNNYYGSLDPQPGGQTGRAGNRGQTTPATGGYNQMHTGINQQPGYGHHQPQQHVPPAQMSRSNNSGSGICYRALYDYEAQDNDEVSFGDGDLIVDCTAEDEGWMTGTVQRTGRRGMLPANYVVSAN